MRSDPKILAFDTSAAHCAAALLSGDQIMHIQTEDMARGQAERLMPLLQEVLGKANLDWTDLSAIAVGCGPGNFTGIRISIAAARGLALALEIPAIGISTFEAISLGTHGRFTLPAPRDQRYAQTLRDGIALDPAVLETGPAEPFDPRLVVPQMARLAAARIGQPQPAPKPLYLRPADAAPSSDTPPRILHKADTDERI